MPTVATIDGISIRFYNDEHPPPHFHAVAAEHQVVIGIDRLRVVAGYLPGPQLRKVIAWAKPRKLELRAAWVACRHDRNPGKIA
jgi:hypothetical protein